MKIINLTYNIFYCLISVLPLKRERKKQYAFTLAEVLITLTVIGVLAAITVPNMIASHQKTTWVTGLKKAYVVGNQVLQKAAIEECGTMDLACIVDGKSLLQVGEVFAKYYNIEKNCKTDTLVEKNNSGCWAVFNDWINGADTDNWDWDNRSDLYKFITADGMSYGIGRYNPFNDYSISSDSPTNKVWGFIYVDVNGKKAPNRRGRDVFLFLITSHKMPLLYPVGGKEYNPDGNGDASKGGDSWWNYENRNDCFLPYHPYGFNCTGRIMEKGWLMDY